MKNSNDNIELKKRVGVSAAGLVTAGMTCGIGTGSTVAYLIEELGRRVKEENLKFVGVPTSFQSRLLCRQYGITIGEPQDFTELDMAIDGADELEEERRLLYVAVTRAKDRLVISFPLRYYHRKHPLGDRYSTAQLCRFLEPAMFELFDRKSHGRIEPTSAQVSSQAIPNAINARLQKLLG